MAELEEITERELLELYGTSMLIMLSRIYDMLALVGSGETGPHLVDKLIAFHKQGKTYCPIPALELDEPDTN